MARFDLSDFEWSAIEPLFPTKVRGVPLPPSGSVKEGEPLFGVEADQSSGRSPSPGTGFYFDRFPRVKVEVH